MGESPLDLCVNHLNIFEVGEGALGWVSNSVCLTKELVPLRCD